MNRIAVESTSGGRRVPSVGSQQRRRGRSTAGGDTREGDESLDLFSRTRDSGLLISLANGSDGQNEPIRLEKISVGSGRVGKSGMEDLLDAEIGKHDYDWLLTPPETPLFPSAVAMESQLSSTAPKGRTTARSVSNARPSRLSASQSESGHSTRPVRSSSVTRPSITNTYSSSSFSNNNRTSVLNTSSASVTSSRPSTPGNRSTTARPSTTSRPIPSRLPTPTKIRPNPTSSGDKSIRPSHNSRPSTPTSARSQTPSNPNPNLNSRSNSRSSTPIRRPTTPAASSAPFAGARFPSVSRIPAANSQNPAAPALRQSSPGLRARAPVRPTDLPDFPIDAPPNLRTKLPERPASAGRARPGMALTVRANSNSEVAAARAAVPVSSNRRNYLPVVSRGRFLENPPTKLHSNYGHEASPTPEVQKPVVSDGGVRRSNKPASAESTGFGRTISKKSLDMALRHMDIRRGMGGMRASSLFPQSIRSAAPEGRPACKSEPVVPLANDEAVADNGSCSRTISPDCSQAASENGDFVSNKSPVLDSLVARESELDLHGSSRYDAILLKEDSKNMNWLHSIEDKSDQSPVFDHRFEPLPEPFGLL